MPKRNEKKDNEFWERKLILEILGFLQHISYLTFRNVKYFRNNMIFGFLFHIVQTIEILIVSNYFPNMRLYHLNHNFFWRIFIFRLIFFLLNSSACLNYNEIFFRKTYQ